MKHIPNILVVDDDQEIGQMLKIMLEHKGFTVIISDRAEKIPGILSNNNVDMIILDMLIAGVKGNEVCTHLKMDAATAHYPIMMMTALPDAEKICRDAGADEFIAKPFEMKQIISKIRSLTNYQTTSS